VTETTIQTGPALDSSSVTRAFTVFLLYAGQGIPIGLFDFAIPAWMAVNGASAQDIGFVVAMIGIPWSFKFIAGFVMDRYTLLAMGRRRAWILGAQTMMIALLLFFAIIDPGPRDVLILGLVALAVNTATVFQDVAVDGLTVDIVPEEERSLAGALSSGGQVMGIAASAALTGAMVYAFGASAAYMACAALVAIITVHVIWVRERITERRLPWSEGEAHEANLSSQARSWLPLAKSALSNTLSPLSLIWIPVLLTRGLAYGVCVVAVPLIASQYGGWTEDRIGSLNGTAQLIAGIATIAIGALIATKLGAQRALMLATFALMALVTWMWMSSESWSDPGVITAFVLGWTAIFFLGGVGEVVIIMRLSPPSAAASQYSVFMAFHNMGISLAGILIGSIAVFGEPQGMLAFLIGTQCLAAVILLIVKFPTERIKESMGHSESADGLAAVRD
jgi:MFS transporter, PAT family, beta-lactamase induction signal transducer AmpG